MDEMPKYANGGIVDPKAIPQLGHGDIVEIVSPHVGPKGDADPELANMLLDEFFEPADTVSTATIKLVVDNVAPALKGHCRRCGRDDVIMHHSDVHLCIECVKAFNNRVSYYRQNVDVVAQARAAGLKLWVQQPGETQWEYTVWCTYRDSYPGKKPSYKSVSEQLLCSSEAVKKIALRWHFQARMQAWMKHCEDETLLQRKTEILEMNKAHIDIASKLREKLLKAIEIMEPSTIKPSEISSLAKTMADLERKAMIDSEAQEVLRNELLVDTDNPNLKKHQTSQNDLAEVVQILLKSGALGSITTVTAKEVTREVTLGLEGGEEDVKGSN